MSSNDQHHDEQNHSSSDDEDQNEDQAGEPPQQQQESSSLFSTNHEQAAAPFNAAGDPSGVPSVSYTPFGNPVNPPFNPASYNNNKPSVFGQPYIGNVNFGQPGLGGTYPIFGAPPPPPNFSPFPSMIPFSQAPIPPYSQPMKPPNNLFTNLNTNTNQSNKKHHYVSPNSKVTNNNHVVESISLSPVNMIHKLTTLELRICHERGITPEQYVSESKSKQTVLQEDIKQLQEIVGDHFTDSIGLAKAKSVEASQSNLFSGSNTAGLFGMLSNSSNSNNPHKSTGLFGPPSNQQTVSVGLFGKNNATLPPQPSGLLFGSSSTPSNPNSGNGISGGLFGANFNSSTTNSSTNVGLFNSNGNSQPIIDSIQAAMSAESNLFNKGATPSLFSNKPTLNLFGPPNPTPTQTPPEPTASNPFNALTGIQFGIGNNKKGDSKNVYSSKSAKLDSTNLVKSICHSPFNVNNLTKTELRICTILGISNLQYPPSGSSPPPVTNPTALAKALQTFQPSNKTQQNATVPSVPNGLFGNTNSVHQQSVFAPKSPPIGLFGPSPPSGLFGLPPSFTGAVNNQQTLPQTKNLFASNTIKGKDTQHLYKPKTSKLDSKHKVNCISFSDLNTHNLSKNELRLCHLQGLSYNQYIAKQQSQLGTTGTLNNLQSQPNQRMKPQLFSSNPAPFFQTTPTSTVTFSNKPTNLFSGPPVNISQKSSQTRTQAFFNVFQNKPLQSKSAQEQQSKTENKSATKQDDVKRVLEAVIQTQIMKKMSQGNEKIDISQFLQQTMEILSKPKEVKEQKKQ